MSSVLTPFQIKFDGLDAKHHIIDLQELSVSLSGISKILNSSAYFIFTGDVPKNRFKQDIRFFAKATKPGSYPIDIFALFRDSGALNFMTDAIASIGSEYIQRLFSIAVLTPSGRTKEMDPHFEALLKLTHKIQNDAQASQHLLIADRAKSEEKYIGLIKELAETRHRAVLDSIRAVGSTSSEMTVGSIETGGVQIDLPTAQSIRSKENLIVGELGSFKAMIDGAIQHNRTVKLYLDGHGDEVFTGDIVDPSVTKWPNAYSRSIGIGPVEIIAKPTFKDGHIYRLAVMDLKKSH